LQGAFEEHEKAFTLLRAKTLTKTLTNTRAKTHTKSNIKTKQIRNLDDFQSGVDALVIPGGESTVQGKLLHDLDLFYAMKAAIESGMPVLGTCAGLLLLAKSIFSDTPSSADLALTGGENTYLATMDIVAKRNAFGRQLGSSSMVGRFAEKDVPMVFIRAPYIASVGEGVKVLSQVDGKIVAAEQGNQLVTAFHPELTGDLTVHEHFLNMV
jgi:5'-phosphate synthase pdxT subunit